MDMDRIRKDARRGIERWLAENPSLSEDGDPMCWTDGRAVAVDVANAILALHILDQSEPRGFVAPLPPSNPSLMGRM